MSARRITVGLIPKSDLALNKLVELTGLNISDVVNRALQMYSFVEEETAIGVQFCTFDPDTRELERVKFL